MGAAGVMLLAAGLSMDAFAVSVCKGLSLGKIDLTGISLSVTTFTYARE